MDLSIAIYKKTKKTACFSFPPWSMKATEEKNLITLSRNIHVGSLGWIAFSVHSKLNQRRQPIFEGKGQKKEF